MAPLINLSTIALLGFIIYFCQLSISDANVLQVFQLKPLSIDNLDCSCSSDQYEASGGKCQAGQLCRLSFCSFFGRVFEKNVQPLADSPAFHLHRYSLSLQPNDTIGQSVVDGPLPSTQGPGGVGVSRFQRAD